MGNMFGMFSFAFWVIRILICETVNFLKFESAGIPIRPFEYIIVLISIIALTEFRQPLQVQSHLEMPGILVQLGHIQRT